jgi:hypothetical protein
MKKICFILALLFLAFLPNANAAPLTNNLIGYWKFDNTGADSSAGGRDLDLYGGVGFATGLFGQALDLHRDATQYAQRPVNDSIYNFSTSDFTIQVWVNLNSIVGEQILLEKFDAVVGSGPGWTLTYYPGWPSPESEKLHFYTEASARIYSNDLQIPTGQWHQIIMRRDDSTFELFYDNMLIGREINSNIFQDSNYPLVVGRRNPEMSYAKPLDGELDEIAIWNRALTGHEIAMLYNDGSGYEIPMGCHPVPEPATMLLLASGLVGLAGLRKKFRHH